MAHVFTIKVSTPETKNVLVVADDEVTAQARIELAEGETILETQDLGEVVV